MNSNETEPITGGMLNVLIVDFDVMRQEMSLKNQWNSFNCKNPKVQQVHLYSFGCSCLKFAFRLDFGSSSSIKCFLMEVFSIGCFDSVIIEIPIFGIAAAAASYFFFLF